ncbi:MAG: hypothetical protein Q9184_000687 [Pyrenodesmia sp. 2 TL-2023]
MEQSTPSLGSSGSSEALSRTPSVTESTDAAVTLPEENTSSQDTDGSEVSDILLPDGSNHDTSSEDLDSEVVQVPEYGILETSDGSTISSQTTSDATAVIPSREPPGLARRICLVWGALLIGWLLLLSLCRVKDIVPIPTQPVVDRCAEQTCHITKMPLRSAKGLLYRVPNAVVGQGRESSGEQLATGFAQAYKDLSQVVVVSNILYQAPHQMRAGRMNLRRMKKRLPPASTAHEPIDQFLHLSLHRDQNLSDFTHMITRLGKSALIKYAATNETLATVRQSPLVDRYTIDSLTCAIGWKSAQEKRVQRQLKSNLDTLRPGVDNAYLAASEQLQAFSELHQIAADIRIQIENDRARFGQEKSDLMRDHHVFKRLMIKAFGSPEPREVIHLTQALIVADEVLDWTTKNKGWLGKLVSGLSDVKGGMDALSDALHRQDRAIRWAADGGAKMEALDEFMMLMEEGVALLRINARAYDQQRMINRMG